MAAGRHSAPPTEQPPDRSGAARMGTQTAIPTLQTETTRGQSLEEAAASAESCGHATDADNRGRQ